MKEGGGSPSRVGAELLDMAERGDYFFRDQDVLNTRFRDDLALLDARWNVFNAARAFYDHVPRDNRDKALAARDEPWLIHYADPALKPWKGIATPWAQCYWQALIRTPFYGEVVASMTK